MQPSPMTSAASSRRGILALLGLTVLLYFFANFQRTVVPGALFSELQSDLDVSAKAVTGFGAAFMYVYAVSQLFSGMLADKYGGYRLITFGGLLFCAGSLLFPLLRNLYLMYLCRIVVGIGASSIYLSMVKEVQKAFPQNFAPWLGAAMFVGYAGGMVANAPFVALVHHIGWRSGLVGAAVVMGAIWLCFLVTRLRTALPPPTDARISFTAFAPALRKRHNWALFLLIGISFAVFYAFQTLVGKKFLEDYCGMSALGAGGVFTATGALSAIASFGTPVACKLLGNRRRPFLLVMGASSLLCTAAGLGALLGGCRAPWLFTAIFLILSLTANMTAVYLALLSETNDLKLLGVCTSFGNFLAYMLVALLGNGAGLLMDAFPARIVDGVRIYSPRAYAAVFGLFAALAAVGFLCALTVRESRGKRIEVP